MLLPVMPPVSPMLAKPVTVIPPGASYEPKWDGFRALVFRDGDDVEFGSRNERPMTRYFPELVRAAKAELPPRCVVDGEIVLPTEQGLDFEALQLRLHPAASRVRLLAEHTPARFIAFDLLALGDDNLMDRPFSERRAALAGALGSGPSFHVTPATTDIATARRWFDEFEGAGLDGVIAKKLDGPYLPGKREMVKVKHHRDADCVAIGYRIHKSGEGVGSILLGLYRADGELQMVGGAASFSVKDRLKLLADLEPLREGDEVREGDPSRWNSAADKRWI
ncbi:ATP-dependent DNA ligase, partial [Mycolicibacterium fortuitum]|uniref:ATP-dependent DNA ligase n=1 Tax=Mycolicibacterium fortuitum TaxID=1766 RepID=UPI000943A51D